MTKLSERLAKVLPQAGWARIAVAAVGGLLALGLVWLVVWKLFFAGHAAREQHATDVVQTEMANGMAQAGQESVRIVVEHTQTIDRINQVTRYNDVQIHNAEGAGDHAPAVAAALHDSLCLRGVYQREPDCAAVHGPGDSERVAGTAAGSVTPQ